MDAGHVSSRVERIDNDLINKPRVLGFLGSVLIELLFKIFLHHIIHKRLHPISIYHQVVIINDPIRQSLPTHFKDLKPTIMASSYQVAIFGLAENPIAVGLSFACVHLYFCFDVPDSDCTVLGVADQVAGLLVEHHARDVVLVVLEGGVLPSYLVCVFPQLYLSII